MLLYTCVNAKIIFPNTICAFEPRLDLRARSAIKKLLSSIHPLSGVENWSLLAISVFEKIEAQKENAWPGSFLITLRFSNPFLTGEA